MRAALARGSALLPDEGTDEGDAVRYWLHYAEGSAMPPLLLKLVFSMLPRRSPTLLRPMVSAIAAKAMKPDIKVFGVEAARYPSFTARRRGDHRVL